MFRTSLSMVAALMFMSKGAVGGIDLSWNACPAAGGTFNVDANCTSPQTFDLVGTFQVSSPHDCFYSMAIYLDLQVEGPSLPPFWHFESGGCNQGMVTAAARPEEVLEGCNAPTPWDSTALCCFYESFHSPNGARIQLHIGDSQGQTTSLSPGQTYYAFHLRFRTDRASEAGGACQGCRDKIAIVWNQATLNAFAPPGQECRESDPVYLVSAGPFGNCATWNSPSAYLCGATPVQQTTWGKLKMLYR